MSKNNGGHHDSSPIVSGEKQQEFRKMIDFLREMEGLSWGQICTLSGLEIRGGLNGPEMIQVAYRRKATEKVFSAVEAVYDERKSAKKPTSPTKTAALSKERRLIDHLREEPGAAQIDIIKRLQGVGPKTLNRLIESGRIVTRKRLDLRGQPILHYLAEDAPPEEAPESPPGAEQGGGEAPEPEAREKGSQAPQKRGDPLTWDRIREELMGVADQILELAEQVEFQAGTPKSIRQEVREIYCKRHDRLIRFIEEELDS